METMTIELPARLVRQVEAEKVPLGQAIVEAVERWLAERERSRVQPSADAEFLAALEQAGMRIAEMGVEWEPLMNTAPRMSPAEIRTMLAGISPLSETIIAEREEWRRQ